MYAGTASKGKKISIVSLIKVFTKKIENRNISKHQ